jgi:hypothetical protein
MEKEFIDLKIYTTTPVGERLKKCKDLGMGIMITPTPNFKPRKEYKNFSCIMDNGAYSTHLKGYPFNSKMFLECIDQSFKLGIKLKWIACPDLVSKGRKSFDYSLEWATGELKTAPSLALVVQDGLSSLDLMNLPDNITTIFIGGSKKWKWQTLPEWSEFCQNSRLKLHVGRCGILDKMLLARKYKADSIDSTNFSRNQTWHIVEQFYRETECKHALF